MFSQKYYQKLTSEKPDIFGSIPERILPEERIEELRAIPCLAIGEISCKASLENWLHLLSQKRPDGFLPTVSYAGIEFGQWARLEKMILDIKKVIEKDLHIFVTDPVILGSPRFWWALNGRFSHELQKRFGFFCHCFGCRLYSYALRVPLCKKLQAEIIISCDSQLQYDGCNLFDSPQALHYYAMFLQNFGIALWHSGKKDSIKAGKTYGITKRPGNVRETQEKSAITCILQDNYYKLDGSLIQPLHIKDFFETFAIPAAAKITSRILAGTPVDYCKEVADTLTPGSKSLPKKSSKKG